MKKSISKLFKISQILLLTILLPNFAYAKNNGMEKPELVSEIQESDADNQEQDNIVSQYPNFSGEITAKYKIDRIVGHKRSNIPASEGLFGVDSNYSLNFSKNWAAKSTLTAYPLIKQDPSFNENESRFRTERGFKIHNTALIIEELQLYFENKYSKFFVGKFDPKFGPSYADSKVPGVFSTEFTADRDLLEEIGFGGALVSDDIEITASTFFLDTSSLDRSVLAKKTVASPNNGLATNTSKFSSYSFTVEGTRLLSFENLSYHLSYRRLGVKKMAGTAEELDYTGSLAYSFQLENNIILVPYIELIKANNFTGIRGRDNNYAILAVTAKRDKWSTSILGGLRSIRQSNQNVKVNDRQLQYSIAYQFSDRLRFDVSAMNLKENNISGLVLGGYARYTYKF